MSTQVAPHMVIGGGATGISVARWLLSQGHRVIIHDTRPVLSAAQHERLARELPEVPVQCGPLDIEQLRSAAQLVVSPGVPLTTPALQQAAAEGIALPGDVELFARACQRPVIAITGSNGKSTVTTLVAELANAVGLNAVAGGNLGTPALDLLAHDADLYVLELSSFQLETTWSLNAAAVTILNVSPDHLDRYDGMAGYTAAKQRIFLGAKNAVINRQDHRTWAPQSLSCVSFGTDEAPADADWGLIKQDNEWWITHGQQAVLAAHELQLLGIHNLLNVQAALALLDAVGIDWQAALPAVRTFTGLAHRCQYVPTNDGIVWVNDSKATNEGATLAAIAGIRPQVKGRLFLLAGGDGKGSDFAELAAVLQRDVDTMLTFGQDGQQLAELKPDSQYYATMAQAIAALRPQLMAGDWVLLAPACASLDQFANYRQRGEQFVALAQGGTA